MRSPVYRIPANPVLSAGSFRDEGTEKDAAVLPITHGRDAVWVTSGRIALAHILQRIGVQAGSRVLVPAYNCQSMVLPINWLGGEPAYYRVNADLSPDMDDLERLADEGAKCLVITHYFGFPLQMESILDFASRRGIPLIEDCAHALFGSYKGRALGAFGDYAICSPWKFLPLLDGGCILSREEKSAEFEVTAGKAAFQIQVLLNSLENSLETGRLGWLSPAFRAAFWLKDRIISAGRLRSGAGASGSIPDSAHGSAEFQSEWMNVRMSLLSRYLFRHVSVSKVVTRRRENYSRMLEAFRNVRYGHPICPNLPQDVVPYVFPLYVQGGDAVYHQLRKNGVPVFRWDDIPEGCCDVASDYQHRLIQLPIHQELFPSELDRIIESVDEAIRLAHKPQHSRREAHAI